MIDDNNITVGYVKIIFLFCDITYHEDNIHQALTVPDNLTKYSKIWPLNAYPPLNKVLIS